MDRVIPNEILALKLAESLGAPIPALTPRDVRLPAIAGKAFAVIGVRRGGKTSFLQRRIADRVAAGSARESQLLLSLEDERLVGMTVADLGWILDEHVRQHPGLREAGIALYLDEVQTVPGWELFVRRLIDSGGVEVFVSGSSAQLLSREIATSLRGRGLEVLVHPFSFREALRHAGAEPATPWSAMRPAERARIDAALRVYIESGGFPEAQGSERRDRFALLTSYIDVMLLRDVIDRHAVSHPHALRWLQRHLLSTPGGTFTVKKLYDSLRSQGVAIAKDTLYRYLDHLQDAFLVRTVGMHSTSERQRMANPRKVYPIDHGLIPLFERTGREHIGRALETVVMLELERRGYSIDWVKSSEGWEVDFLAESPGERSLLVQVSLDTVADATWEREVRALADAARAMPEARALLITLDSSPPRALPSGLEWMPAAAWLLERSAS